MAYHFSFLCTYNIIYLCKSSESCSLRPFGLIYTFPKNSLPYIVFETNALSRPDRFFYLTELCKYWFTGLSCVFIFFLFYRLYTICSAYIANIINYANSSTGFHTLKIGRKIFKNIFKLHLKKYLF